MQKIFNFEISGITNFKSCEEFNYLKSYSLFNLIKFIATSQQPKFLEKIFYEIDSNKLIKFRFLNMHFLNFILKFG